MKETETTCEVRGIPVCFETIGEGRPMLLLHGGGGEHHGMMRITEPFFAGHPNWKRFYVDMPGHGKTPAPEWLSSHDQVLEIMLGFIDQVIGRQPFAIAGASRGGLLARGILAKRAEDVSGILLIIPAPSLPSALKARGEVPDPVVLVKDEELLAGLTRAEAQFLGGFVVQDRKALEDYLRGLPYSGLADSAFAKRFLTERNYTFSFDVDQEPATFDKPALVIAGRQDSLVGFRDSMKMISQFTRGTYALLDRAGHALPVEQEDLMRALAVEWLRRVDEELRHHAA